MERLHVELFETVRIANDTYGGIIIHLPTREAQALPPPERQLDPPSPFPANAACPRKFSQSIIPYKMEIREISGFKPSSW